MRAPFLLVISLFITSCNNNNNNSNLLQKSVEKVTANQSSLSMASSPKQSAFDQKKELNNFIGKPYKRHDPSKFKSCVGDCK